MADNEHAAPNAVENDDQPSKTSTLTPIRAHYFKKALVQLEFARELQLITAEAPPNVSTLSYLGPPFSPLPKDVPPADMPFLKYIFRQFVLTFPFIAVAPKDFYSQKLQPFVAVLISRGLTPASALDDQVHEDALQKKVLQRLERNLYLFLGSAIKLVEPEEIVHLTQADLNRLEALTAQRDRRRAKSKDSFDVNIVSVRTVIEKGRLRNRAHDEFIIRTRRSRYPDVYVSRRYGDFRTLYQELTKAHPEEDIRSPPAKDHTHVKTPVVSPTSSRTPAPDASSMTLVSSTSKYPDATSPYDSGPSSPRNSGLAREKNRLTLRSYLHSLLSVSAIASSPVIRSFLLSGATALSSDELEDAKRREEADKSREEGRKRFAEEIAIRIDRLREAVKSVKGEVMGKDGLKRFFSTIKETPDLKSLPETYHSVVEWARFSLASTVYQTFVASDEASETFAGLKRVHSQMPYFMLKAALKITNPVTMIRNVMDLFLATPFGGKSLLQRLFTSSLTEEVRLLEEEIQAVINKVNDPVMCNKMRQFVYASRDIQNKFKEEARKEQMDVIIVVLKSLQPPVLSGSQLGRLSRAHTAHTAYLRRKACLEDSDDDEGPQDENGWLIEDLRALAYLYSKLKDREELIDLIFEGFTADLLKDILTIFYSPLAQVYRAANIADSLNDLQNFISDLIRTVEAVDTLDQQDTHMIVHTFIDLIRRHEQAFYTFVHKVHSKGEGLFNDFIQWIELFLTILRDGLGEGISVEFLLPHNGEEREQIISEIDKVVLYHYKLKILYEEKLRRRFGRAQGNSASDAEDAATRDLLESVTAELNFGELASGDAVDLAAQETDEESSSEDYSTSEDESDSQASAPEKVAPKSLPISPVSSQSVQGYQKPQPHSPSTPTPTQQERPPPPPLQRDSTVITRHRSLSLRSVRSLMTLNNSISSRKGQDTPPPVPPVPRSGGSIYSKPLSSKALPPRPMSQPSREHPSSRTVRRSQSQIPQNSQPKPGLKSIHRTLNPPDLLLIPQLLPVFVEMMRPSLSVKKTTK